MRLNELTEALDNPYPYTWYERSNDTWTAYAELNSERSSDGRDDEDATLRIIADRVSVGDDWDDDERVFPTIWELSFMTGYKTHKTGAGDQFRIFATVVAAFTDWWKQMGSKLHDIDEIEFTADKANDGKSRAVLYARFAKKFAQMTGFNLETKQDSYQDVFTFVNPQSSFAEASVTEVSKEEFDAIQNGYVDIEFDKKWWPLDDDYPLIKHIGKAIGATSWTSWGKVGVPWSEKEMIGGGGTYMLKGDFGHILLDAAKSFRPEQILMAQISTSKRGGGIGSKVMNAIKSYADQKGLPITIYKVTNQKFFDKFEWLEKTGVDTYEYSSNEVKESAGVGRVVKGVNTTVDVGVDEIINQVKKFGNDVDRDGKPKKNLRNK
jgi:GNAT superfamily N-acetyltransferase